jgi:hypothetical protein
MKDDPIIAEIRKVRHRISEECDHDPYKIVERYMKIQEARESREKRKNRGRNPRSPAATG